MFAPPPPRPPPPPRHTHKHIQTISQRYHSHILYYLYNYVHVCVVDYESLITGAIRTLFIEPDYVIITELICRSVD